MLKITPYLDDKVALDEAVEKLRNFSSSFSTGATYSELCQRLTTEWSAQRQLKYFQTIATSLKNAQKEFCHYCEHDKATAIEHIAPKALFPNLAFDWDNYVMACTDCNQNYKGESMSIFNCPLGNDTKEIAIVTKDKKRIYEQPVNTDIVFLNQRKVNPMDYLSIDIRHENAPYVVQPHLMMYDEFQRLRIQAEYTIEKLGFDDTKKNFRKPLGKLRHNKYDTFYDWLRKCTQIRKASSQEEIQDLFLPNISDLNRELDELKVYCIDRIKTKIQESEFPSVWYEMKRQAPHISELKALFEALPEALEW